MLSETEIQRKSGSDSNLSLSALSNSSNESNSNNFFTGMDNKKFENKRKNLKNTGQPVLVKNFKLNFEVFSPYKNNI